VAEAGGIVGGRRAGLGGVEEPVHARELLAQVLDLATISEGSLASMTMVSSWARFK